jgi:hypothetical protein
MNIDRPSMGAAQDGLNTASGLLSGMLSAHNRSFTFLSFPTRQLLCADWKDW